MEGEEASDEVSDEGTVEEGSEAPDEEDENVVVVEEDISEEPEQEEVIEKPLIPLPPLCSKIAKPFMFGYVDNGFPVWMINNRGTEYSRRHTVFTDAQQDYWSFDIFDQYQDIKANIDIIKAYAGYDIMWYIGYSGGTTQMIYGMSQDEPYLANRIQKAILLAPCTIIEPEKKPPGALEIFTAQVDVYEFSGPSWKDDK